MAKAMRRLKASATGRLSRKSIQGAVRALHVFPAAGNGGWQVKELGTEGLHKRFASMEEAIAFAKQAADKNNSQVLIHRRNARLKVEGSEKPGVYKLVYPR